MMDPVVYSKVVLYYIDAETIMCTYNNVKVSQCNVFCLTVKKQLEIVFLQGKQNTYKLSLNEYKYYPRFFREKFQNGYLFLLNFWLHTIQKVLTSQWSHCAFCKVELSPLAHAIPILIISLEDSKIFKT